MSNIIESLTALMVPIDSVRLDSRNVRTHPDRNIETIKKSLITYGQRKPVVVNQDGVIEAGNGLWQAAKALGWQEIAAVKVVDDPDHAKGYGIMDNQSALLADWDLPSLKDMLQELDTGAFDMDATGFSGKEIEELMTQFHVVGEGLTDDDAVPEKVESVCKTGDLWQLGDHRLLCGDATKKEDVDRLMNGEKADMVFTSPPYNVGKKYNSHDDNQSLLTYTQMISDVANNCFIIMADGRLVVWNVGVSPKSRPYHHALILEEAGFELFRHIVWKKTGAQIPLWQNSKKQPNARRYMPNYNHEMIYLMSKGEVEYGRKTKMPDDINMDVWDISQFSAGGHNHPAAFPVALAGCGISAMTAEKENTLDPFGGSGSTLIACEKLDRKCYMMEIDEHYCDVIIERWQQFTGRQAEKIWLEESLAQRQ